MGKKPTKVPASKAAAAVKAAAKTGSKKQRGGDGASSSSSATSHLRDPLDRQLALLGLRVKNITADGNCFFRSLSDQLQGDESRHSELRAGVCSLMADRPDDFAPFVEDDQTLDAYLTRMRKEGVWAGHMELQAASLLLEVNIAVYQADQPRWCITNFAQGSRMLHVSFHDGEHYNSIRRADDYSKGTPADIGEALAPVEDAAQARQCWCAADEKQVAEGTGCDNPVLIRKQLQQAGGDVSAAIEAVIEIMAGDDYEDTAPAAAAVAAGELAAATEEGVDGADEADTADTAVPVAEAAPAVVPRVVTVTGTAEGYSQAAIITVQDGLAVAVTGAAPTISGQQAAPQDQDEEQCAEAPQHAASQQPCSSSSSSSNGTPANKSGQQHLLTEQGGKAAAASPATTKSTTTTTSSSSSRARGVKLRGSSSSSSDATTSRRGAGAGTKAPGRNKPCPCGSGRKHKNCCAHKRDSQKAGPAGAAGGAGGADGLPAALATLHI